MTKDPDPGRSSDRRGDQASAEELRRFRELQSRLRAVSQAIEGRRPWDHTSVVVPSLSFHPQELAKIAGAPFYEERLLFSLIRLRHPRARVVYVSSQPIHPEIVDYYLQHLVGVPASHARSRLKMLCAYDASSRPLTEKILERPRLVERIRGFVGDRRGYLTCFNSTALERTLAVELGIPLNAVDPELLHLGTKSGSRKNIVDHYDLGNDFYRLFLDDTMTYSSAVFERPEATLKEASIEKYDRICRKLLLSEQVLCNGIEHFDMPKLIADNDAVRAGVDNRLDLKLLTGQGAAQTTQGLGH